MARGGFRANSGRKRGASRATIEKELVLARIEAERGKKPGRKLAKEVLDDLMHLCLQYAAMHQPLPPGVVATPDQRPDQAKFVLYANMAGDFAGRLVKFQSPTFQAVAFLNEPRPGADSEAAQIAMAAGQVAGHVEQLTPQQAYRLFRDMDVIDMEPAKKAKPGKSNKAASG